MRAIFSLICLAGLSACEIPPNYVERIDIDDAMARGAFKTVCVGLDMKEEKTRRYAAERLVQIEDPIAQECLCAGIVDEKKGWDAAVAEGMKGTDRDDLASCFAQLVAQPDLPKRAEAVSALANIPAPSARKTLAGIAAEAGVESDVRVRAIDAIAGVPEHKDLLIGLLAKDEDPTVRAKAAESVYGFKDEASMTALQAAYANDEDGVVRGTALIALKKAGADGIDEMLCAAMMDDPSGAVREKAVGAYKGTKRAEAIACLRKRALTEEPEAAVRTKLLAVLKSSPSKDATKVLCDAIPFWVKTYLQDEMPEKIPGTDIIKVQNDRDWDNSYECIGNAVRRSGGYSCYGRLYTGWWFRQVGGTAHLPRCPGYEGTME